MSNVRSNGSGDGAALLRIGELARRCGVPAATLRAWERRYSVVEPVRGESGYRLYSAADERRVREMARLVEAGIAPAEAAARLRAGPTDALPTESVEAAVGGEAVTELVGALLGFDEERADELLDRAIAAFTTETVLEEFVLPALRELGEMWARGEASISQEHFASGLLRGRLLGLARGWGAGGGRLALLACPSGEHHDLGVIAFGLSLRRRGWRISFLGGDVPGEALMEAAAQVRPDVVVLYGSEDGLFAAIAPELTEVASRSALLLAGAGADPALADRIGAAVLEAGPVEAAARLPA